MSNRPRFLPWSLWSLFLLTFMAMKAETTTPVLLSFLLNNFVEDIVNLPINMSRTEIHAAKVAEMYQRVQTLNEYITLKTGTQMNEATMNEHEHDQQTTSAEKDDTYRLLANDTCINTKMHKLSELADDVRVKTICGIGYIDQTMWIDQRQGLLTAFTMSLLSNPTARLIVFMNDVFGHATTVNPATTPTSSTKTNPQGTMTPSTVSLQRANAAIQVTPLVLEIVYIPLT